MLCVPRRFSRVLTLCDPMNHSHSRLLCPRDSLERAARSFSRVLPTQGSNMTLRSPASAGRFLPLKRHLPSPLQKLQAQLSITQSRSHHQGLTCKKGIFNEYGNVSRSPMGEGVRRQCNDFIKQTHASERTLGAKEEKVHPSNPWQGDGKKSRVLCWIPYWLS